MKGFSCDELYAFVAIDQDGNEGIVSGVLNDEALPMVTADLDHHGTRLHRR